MDYGDIDLRSIAKDTGISEERIRIEIAVMEELRDVMHALPNAVLFGGTAINKIYFGDKQRLSFDIDIRCMRKQSCLSYLQSKYITTISTAKFWSFNSPRDIRVDFAMDYPKVKIVEREARSLLYYYGHEYFRVNVRTYEFEFLLAEKILTLAARGTAKDLYDAWKGIKEPHDEKKVLNYLLKYGRINKTDPRVIITRHHHADTDMSKIDTPYPNLDGKSMYEEVKQYIIFLFFKPSRAKK